MRRAPLLLLAALLTGCSSPTAVVTAPPPPLVTATTPAPPGLDQLPIRDKAPLSGYDRQAQFMPHGWDDPDRNGSDARRDALDRQAVADVVRRGTHHCVLTAVIADPYTGKRIPSAKADTDHVVALADAWQTGAGDATYPAADRLALAQDPGNLIATSASVNRAKGDRDAAEWLPPEPAYRCMYVARQVTVKARYRLWVTRAEHDAIADVLGHCSA